MFPWLFLWTPQFHFPWSGALEQHISPETFFGAINPDAGDGVLEHKIFDTASYGKQIGILSDVVLTLAEQEKSLFKGGVAGHALKQLQQTVNQVNALKEAHRKSRIDDAIAVLRELQASDPEQLDLIVARFRHHPQTPRAALAAPARPGGEDGA